MIIGMDEFQDGDPVELYSRMRPDQRTAIANEFTRQLILCGDSAADRFSYAAHDPIAAAGESQGAVPEVREDVIPVHPELLTPEQAADVHRYTRERHPDLFDDVMRHPLTMAVLAAPGEEVAPHPPDEESPAVPRPGAPPAHIGATGALPVTDLDFGGPSRR